MFSKIENQKHILKTQLIPQDLEIQCTVVTLKLKRAKNGKRGQNRLSKNQLLSLFLPIDSLKYSATRFCIWKRSSWTKDRSIFIFKPFHSWHPEEQSKQNAKATEMGGYVKEGTLLLVLLTQEGGQHLTEWIIKCTDTVG